MSLLEKAQQCIEMSHELLYAGDNAGSLACALKAAEYLQLIRLLRQEVTPEGKEPDLPAEEVEVEVPKTPTPE